MWWIQWRSQLTGKPLYDYIATTLPVDGYDCSLTEFIGPYRDESCPIAVEEGHCRNQAPCIPTTAWAFFLPP